LGQQLIGALQQIADHDLCAVIGHGPSDGRADTARATGHERNSFESRHQNSLRLFPHPESSTFVRGTVPRFAPVTTISRARRLPPSALREMAQIR
jgi:hypothetical protein